MLILDLLMSHLMDYIKCFHLYSNPLTTVRLSQWKFLLWIPNRVARRGLL